MGRVHVAQNIKTISITIFITVMVSFGLFVAVNTRVAHAATDTCTWTGAGSDSNVTTAANWTGCDNGNVPENGDNLVFPTGPTNKTVVFDTTSWFGSTTVSGSGYTFNDSASNDFNVQGDMTISGDNNTFNTEFRMYPTTTSSFIHSGSGNSFATYMVIQPQGPGSIVNFDIQTDLNLPMIAQAGATNIGTVNKLGTGTLELTGNAITGVSTDNGINIFEGQWRCDTTDCLGAYSNEIILDDNGDNGASSLYLGGGGTVVNPITFNTVSGQKSVLSIASDTTLTGDITLHDNANMVVSGSHTATIDSAVAIASGKTLATYGDATYNDNSADFSGIISGDGGLIFSDIHASLSGSNTFTGETNLYNQGGGTLLTVVDNNSLGNSSSGTVVHNGATLEFNDAGSIIYDEPITVEGNGVGGSYPGAIVNTNKYVGLYGGLTLTGDTTIHNNSDSQYIGFLSQISGNYDLTLTSEHDYIGFVFQSSGANNSYKDLIVNGSYVDLYPDNGDLVVPHNLTLNAINGHTSLIVMERDNTIADDGVITLNNDTSQEAVLFNSGVGDIVGTIAGDGTVSINDSDAHFQLGGGDTSGTFSGTINGYANSQIDIIGGTWTFTGTNADVGNGFEGYYVSGGTMLANNSNTTLGSSPFSISSGVIGGSSTIGQISVYSGTVSPGNSPGCLSVNGDVAFADQNGIYHEQLQNSAACTGYDRLTATGTIYLNDATLSLELLSGFSAGHGQVFTILQGDAVTGTFSGLADGDTVQVDSLPFIIHYTANTVTLTYNGATIPAVTTADSSLAATGRNIAILLALAVVLVLMSLKMFERRILHRR